MLKRLLVSLLAVALLGGPVAGKGGDSDGGKGGDKGGDSDGGKGGGKGSDSEGGKGGDAGRVGLYTIPPGTGVRTGYRYTVVNEQLVLVEPRTRRIVQIVR